jgi:predicted nucleic acid-binding protein
VIVLDTNVLSELMRRSPDPTVVKWLDRQPTESIWTTSITLFEVRWGLDLIAPGRRRRELEVAFEQLIEDDLQGRIQLFDAPAANAAGSIAARSPRSGHGIEVRDLQIAGIVEARRAKLATRNLRHFDGVGIDLVNPWSA